MSSSDIDFDSLDASSGINRAASPAAVIGRRGLEPQRSGSSPEVARPGQFSPPQMSHSAPSPGLALARTNSGFRLKPEASNGRVNGPSPLAASSSGPLVTPSEPVTAEPSEDEVKLKKRSHAVLEIVNTEKDYVQDLAVIREVYLRHLDREAVISKMHLNDIFSNVEQLYEVNNQVCNLMQLCLGFFF